MAIHFTDQQRKVIDARNHNILVSAAAGSGKTAVLVERIVQLITEGEHPFDIDQLLVVTFTKAAAAQMRERISDAIDKRLDLDPDNLHLQQQSALLPAAQITTIDSFCTFLLRNNFSDIGLDPGFRQMDEMEAGLMKSDAMKDMLEEQYSAGTPDFAFCVEYFCTKLGDEELQNRILDLYAKAMSHPWPDAWLREHAGDYDVESGEDLLTKRWFQESLETLDREISDAADEYDELVRLCSIPGGPYMYRDVIAKERDALRAVAESAGEEETAALYERLSGIKNLVFGSFQGKRAKKDDPVDEDLKNTVSSRRKDIRARMERYQALYFRGTPDDIAAEMQQVQRPLHELVRLVLAFEAKYAEAKKDKNVIDFDDLEHLALEILAKRNEDGSVSPKPAAEMYRAHFAEILIDEYQDSNDVQELLLSIVSGESEGRYNRFMVGDVKQSIYKFRLARPEIFMEKYAAYRPDDDRTERIDLDANFRSRKEVLDTVNAIFSRIMRPEIGGVDYDEAASLKCGNRDYQSFDDAKSELLIVDERKSGETDGSADGREASLSEGDKSSEGSSGTGGEEDSLVDLDRGEREALAIAQRIHELIRSGRVTDEGTKKLRPVRYGDIVVLLRSTAGWDEKFRGVFEQEGIPCYVASRAGYFATEEIREIVQYLRVLDNPRQDIPLYGAMHGYFGGFTEEDAAKIRAFSRGTDYYTAVAGYAGLEPLDVPEENGQAGSGFSGGPDEYLSTRCRSFLEELDRRRESLTYLSIHELLEQLVTETGYEDYITALPAGSQRLANLSMLLEMAVSFEKTSYTGLFRFLRYLDEMRAQEVDMGEANTLDENADVVRIMTIHKSKGLEFPIVFAAGLSRRFNRRDQNAKLLVDNDLGIGLEYANPELRCRRTTLRRELIADKITRDTLGEELRVLYVAMTRAKEKLILTGTVRDFETVFPKLQNSIPHRKDKLPVPMIAKASCYMNLILDAVAAGEADGSPIPVAVTTVDSTDLTIREAGEHARGADRRAALDNLTNQFRKDGIRVLPDQKLAERLLTMWEFHYPHADLEGLYTKTTVTELKRAAAGRSWEEDESMAGMQEGRKLYPDPPITPYLPTFARDSVNPPEDTEPRPEGNGVMSPKETEESSRGGSQVLPSGERAGARVISAAAGSQGGAFRGTLLHRAMQLLDYERFREPSAVTEESFYAWMEELITGGQFTAQEASYIRAEDFLPFFRTELARRMADAALRGRLRREQPFVMGIAANRIQPAFPADETMLIQGIIDAYFEENGKLIVVDFKTDRVHGGWELVQRYRVQLNYYAEALGRMYGMPVSEKLIYSFALGRVVPIV